MTETPRLQRPILARHARYRWDRVREQHQVVFPEGVLLLNDTAAHIIVLCDGRTVNELIDTLEQDANRDDLSDDVYEFLYRLERKGLLREANEPLGPAELEGT